jgi:predicted dehydrogenase
MILSPEEKKIGKENFCAAIGGSQMLRSNLKKAIAKNLESRSGLGAFYFNYGDVSRPLRIGVIGTGDQGSTLLGALNPKYHEVKAVADIRPYSIWRAFHGDRFGDSFKTRPGLMKTYGWTSEDAARKKVKVYGNYQELIDNAKADGVEAVVIALPLFLHGPAMLAAMKAGLHVLGETVMAQNVAQCKDMARTAKKADLILSIGYQRHYNVLYQDALAIIASGVLGDVHSFRAQWHSGSIPGKDKWQPPVPTKDRKSLEEAMKKYADALQVEQAKAQLADADVDAAKFGYQSLELKGAKDAKGYSCSPLEELIRWRLWNRTGAGMMAEFGTHQLDGVGIFVHAIHKYYNEKADMPNPLAVVAAGNRVLFPADREIEDHVSCIVDYPLPGYSPNDDVARRKKLSVQYSAMNGNGTGAYSEMVFGTEGTLVMESEKDAMLYRGNDTKKKIAVAPDKAVEGSATNSKKKMIEPGDDGDPDSIAYGHLATKPATATCGFAEELEHWAYCILNRSAENQPLCTPKNALTNAVIALTANKALREGRRIDFDPKWFDINDDATPDGSKPTVSG